jgi:phage-related protein
VIRSSSIGSLTSDALAEGERQSVKIDLPSTLDPTTCRSSSRIRSALDDVGSVKRACPLLDVRLSIMITRPIPWRIAFSSPRVEQDTLSLPDGILASLLRTLELIEEFGPTLGRPHTAPLGRGLFEIRARGREGIARSVFCTQEDRQIVILMTVIKKREAIPAHQMETARKRMKEVRDNG